MKPSPSAPEDLDSDIEEISNPGRKEKGKAKAIEPDYGRTAAARNKGKRKATSDDDDDDIQVVEQPKRQKTTRAGSEVKETGTTTRTRAKPSGRAASKQPAAVVTMGSEEKDDDSGGVDVAHKNAKKRKINIFPTGNGAIQFSFGMSNVCFFFRNNLYLFFRFAELCEQLNDDRLNIPTTLSPVKEDELVPSRSIASTMKPYSGSRR